MHAATKLLPMTWTGRDVWALTEGAQNTHRATSREEAASRTQRIERIESREQRILQGRHKTGETKAIQRNGAETRCDCNYRGPNMRNEAQTARQQAENKSGRSTIEGSRGCEPLAWKTCNAHSIEVHEEQKAQMWASMRYQ